MLLFNVYVHCIFSSCETLFICIIFSAALNKSNYKHNSLATENSIYFGLHMLGFLLFLVMKQKTQSRAYCGRGRAERQTAGQRTSGVKGTSKHAQNFVSMEL